MFAGVRWLSVFLVSTMVFAVGCGGPPAGPVTYKVTGTVTYDSTPVDGGEIIIRSKDGQHAAGSIITNGKYELKATAGPKIVEISAMRDVPGKFREDNPGEKNPVREQYIPKKYNTATTLTLEVGAKDNLDANFNLEK